VDFRIIRLNPLGTTSAHEKGKEGQERRKGRETGKESENEYKCVCLHLSF
jgi:hypothetical protein